MIRTPSLRGRLLLAGIAGLALVTVTLDAFLFVSLRERLEASLVEVLDAREQVVRQLDTTGGAEQVAIELARAGVPAIVVGTDGEVHLSDPPGRSFGVVPPGRLEGSDVETRAVALEDGTMVEVQVARGGADRTLRLLLLFEGIGTITVLLAALLVLRRVAASITRPIEQIVAVADAIAEGDTGRRLDPTQPETELGRMATAFDRTVDALEAALGEARDAQAAGRRFLSDAAHQLRTPLAGLRASADSLLRDPDSPERDPLLANIARESVRASRLVDSLLHVARLDRGGSLTFVDLDLRQVVAEERDRALTLAPHLAVEVTTQGTDFVIGGDRAALKDAIANLLDNARNHARDRIDIHLEQDVGSVRVEVHDDGPGVPPGSEEEVFERFVSLGGAGSGLGLAIARGVARSHGGELTALGATFTLQLPRALV